MDNSYEAIREDGPVTRKAGVWKRIWKYRFHYVIVLPALLLLAVFKAYPLFMTVWASFQDYNVLRGMTDSAWIGWSNYRHVLAMPEFHHMLVNTLLIKLMYTACCGIAALFLALALSAVASGKLRNALAALMLMPYFMPAVVFAYLAAVVLSSSSSPLGIHSVPLAHPELFRGVYVIVEISKTIGVPVLIAVGAIGASHAAAASDARQLRASFLRLNVVPAMIAIAAFMLMQFSSVLANQFELMDQLVNPLVYQTGDTLDNEVFRSTFMLMEPNVGNPLAVIQAIVQFLCTLIAYYIVRGLFARRLFTPHNGSVAEIRPSGRGKNAAGAFVSVLYALVVLAVLYLLFVYPFTIRDDGPGLSTLVSGSRFAIYLVVYLVATALFMLITVTMSFPLTVKDLPGRSVYKWFLLAIMSVGSITFMDYAQLRDFRLTNTVFAVCIAGIFSIAPIFVLKSIYNAKYAVLLPQYEGRGEMFMFFRVYLPAVRKPLLALGALQFIALWNSYYAPLVHLNKPSLFPPTLSFLMATKEVAANGKLAYDPATLLQFGALIALPSLLVLLLMRRWLTAEVLTGQVRNL